MKKLVKVIILAVVLVAGVSSYAAAVEASGDVYAGVYSQYLWRGIDFSGNLPVIQGGTDISLGKFTVSYWTNMQLVTEEEFAEFGQSGEITETDLVLDYSTDLSDLVSLSVGNITYTFNAADALPTTNELYVSTTFNTLLSPSLTVYWDWDEAQKDNVEGLFFTAAIGHTIELMDKAALNLGALISYNKENFGVALPYSDFHNYELSASIDFTPMENLTVTPSLLFSEALSDDAKDALESHLVSGLNVSYAF